MSLSRLGTIDPAPGAAADSLATLEEARKLIEPIAGLNTGSAETANQIASITEYEGHRQEELGRYPDAIESTSSLCLSLTLSLTQGTHR
jgi:hypothetical protein